MCTDYGNLENGYRTLEGTTEGNIVTFGCDEGYELLGNPVLSCGSDGFWIGAWPTCVGCKFSMHHFSLVVSGSMSICLTRRCYMYIAKQ